MTMARTDENAMVAAAIAGEESAFTALTERHRRELHVHCYRMLASFDEAEAAKNHSKSALQSTMAPTR